MRFFGCCGGEEEIEVFRIHDVENENSWEYRASGKVRQLLKKSTHGFMHRGKGVPIIQDEDSGQWKFLMSAVKGEDVFLDVLFSKDNKISESNKEAFRVFNDNVQANSSPSKYLDTILASGVERGVLRRRSI